MTPRDSSDADIQALELLCERLYGFDDRVSLEWLDGCMAALLAGPRALPPARVAAAPAGRRLGAHLRRPAGCAAGDGHACWAAGT